MRSGANARMPYMLAFLYIDFILFFSHFFFLSPPCSHLRSGVWPQCTSTCTQKNSRVLDITYIVGQVHPADFPALVAPPVLPIFRHWLHHPFCRFSGIVCMMHSASVFFFSTVLFTKVECAWIWQRTEQT